MSSEYFNALTDATRLRYLEKINVISGKDAYTLSEFSRNIEDFPKIAYGDIINYLMFERSSYTMDEFKAYKRIDSYNQFLCGWVKEVAVKKINGVCVVIAKVLHSQKLNATPLAVWVIAKPNRQISSAHCNCVAGLGETCSHIGALLFAVDDNIRKLEVQSVTGVKAYWKVPSAGPGELAASKNIDYTSNKKLSKIGKGEVDACTPSRQTVTYLIVLLPEIKCLAQTLSYFCFFFFSVKSERFRA